jgi:OHCU decarboxylase
MDLAELNTLPAATARAELEACCASTAWVEEMLARRPFHDLSALLTAAEQVWWDLTPTDWYEAFAAHPRIGERPAGGDRSSRWSRAEQAGIGEDDAAATELAECNREYEERFGHVFLIFATGRSATDILDECRRRLRNDPLREATEAAAEHARITNLRLRRLVSE